MKKLYSLILLAFFQVLICNAGLPYSTLEVDSTGLIQNTNVTLTATNTIQQKTPSPAHPSVLDSG